ANEDITLVNVQDDAHKEMYDVDKEMYDVVTLAQALTALKSVKPKVKGDVIEEPNVLVNVASASTKAKIEADHELAQRLQADEQKSCLLKKRKNYINNS
ncbi:hypothetical protein Tco_1259999, partial [Tanacetum coccineum]